MNMPSIHLPTAIVVLIVVILLFVIYHKAIKK